MVSSLRLVGVRSSSWKLRDADDAASRALGPDPDRRRVAVLLQPLLGRRAGSEELEERLDVSIPAQAVAWMQCVQYMFMHYNIIVAIGVFCVVIGFALIGFWGYHMWLVWGNTTTNEGFKWSDLKESLKRQKRQLQRKRLRQQQRPSWQPVRRRVRRGSACQPRQVRWRGHGPPSEAAYRRLRSLLP